MTVFGARGPRAVTLAGVALAMMVSGAALPAAADEIVITIERIRALDRIDPGGGQADFYARVTIDGQEFKTPVVRRANDVKPNWVVKKEVPAGTYAVKLEIDDRDVLSKDDMIDINRIDAKRHLDFRVRTRPCRVLDFAVPYDCRGRGAVITRAGAEKKSAEITFRVDTTRR